MTICGGSLSEYKQIETVRDYLDKLNIFIKEQVRLTASTKPNQPQKKEHGNRPNNS